MNLGVHGHSSKDIQLVLIHESGWLGPLNVEIGHLDPLVTVDVVAFTRLETSLTFDETSNGIDSRSRLMEDNHM